MTEPIPIHPATDADSEVVTRIFDAANPAWATSAGEYRTNRPAEWITRDVALLNEPVGDGLGLRLAVGRHQQPCPGQTRLAGVDHHLGEGRADRVRGSAPSQRRGGGRDADAG